MRSNRQAPLDDSADTVVRPAPPRERGGETFLVEAIRESDSDSQRPELREIKSGRKYSERRVARSDQTGFKEGEVAGAESGLENRSDAGIVAGSGGVENLGAGVKPVSASPEKKAMPGSILNVSAVANAITQKTSLGSLVGDCDLLSGFFLRKHVTPDEIANVVPPTENVEVHDTSYVSDYNFFLRKHVTPDEIANVVPSTENVEVRVTSQFSDYNLRYSVALSDALRNAEANIAQRFLETRRFRHDYVVSVFDEALVVTLSPYSDHPELLAIAPMDSEYEEFFGSLLSSSRITELFVGAAGDRDGELRLYGELDCILDYFRAT